jgi:hypothetical protein
VRKNLFLLILSVPFLLPGLFSGCKKDTGSVNYLRGKIDGVSFECNSNIWATPEGSGDKIIAFRGDWSTYSSIRFYLDGQGSNITTGTYDFQTGNLYNVVLYENNDGYSAGYFCDFASPCTFEGSGKITLLEISKKHIKGTFEFVTSGNGATGVSKTVSDGEFYIKR